jgi:hypothetical protein
MYAAGFSLRVVVLWDKSIGFRKNSIGIRRKTPPVVCSTPCNLLTTPMASLPVMKGTMVGRMEWSFTKHSKGLMWDDLWAIVGKVSRKSRIDWTGESIDVMSGE